MSDDILPVGKTCTKCAEFKLLEEFPLNTIGRFGRSPACRACAAKARREYVAANKELVAERKRAYRASPKVKAATSIYNKQYAAKNADSLREKRTKEYHETKDAKREHKAQLDKAYRERNKEEISARRKIAMQENDEARLRSNQRAAAWYAEHKEESSENGRAYYLENRVEVKARVKAYQQAHPEETKFLHRIKAHRRRRRLDEAGGSFTRQDIQWLMLLQRGKCVYCKVSLDEGYHIDHIMPVAKGGGNHPENLQLLCPACNLAKSAKLPHVFAQERGYLI